MVVGLLVLVLVWLVVRRVRERRSGADRGAPAEHERLWGLECYYRVFSTVNGGRAREHDLFEGLRAPAAAGAGEARP